MEGARGRGGVGFKARLQSGLFVLMISGLGAGGKIFGRSLAPADWQAGVLICGRDKPELKRTRL